MSSYIHGCEVGTENSNASLLIQSFLSFPMGLLSSNVSWVRVEHGLDNQLLGNLPCETRLEMTIHTWILIDGLLQVKSPGKKVTLMRNQELMFAKYSILMNKCNKAQVTAWCKFEEKAGGLGLEIVPLLLCSVTTTTTTFIQQTLKRPLLQPNHFNTFLLQTPTSNFTN